MKHFISFLIFILTGFYSFSVTANEECLQWMLDGSVNPGSDNCEIDCAVIGVDMGTFNCPTQCEKLCKTTIPKKYVDKYVYVGALTPSERGQCRFLSELRIAF
jgi:hypothetical protein